MATTTTITKILFRRGNEADRQNTILASGEPGWTLDTSRLWIGDGRTPGGLPALSATDYHLHYVDEHGDTGSTLRQRLDINMVGLSATMAGDRSGYSRMFHATDRAITNDYKLQFTGVNTASEDPDIVYAGPADKTFKIDRAEGSDGVINIGDTLVIDTSTNTITFGTDDATFNVIADRVAFAEGDMTLFEDKTIDLNIPMVGETQKFPGSPEADAATADKTGFYISHVGYASAGRFAVAEGADQEAWSTFWLAPPVYDQNWDTGLDRLNRANNTTIDWNGWTDAPLNITTGGQQYGSKPLAIRSVRPGNKDGAGYDGYADLVFETGLLVYGPGDEDVKQDGWNGYLINQSVDTGAVITCAGLKIEGPNAQPMGVESGGTGTSVLAAGGVLIANESDSTGPIQSLVLSPGQLITGDSNSKARATSLMTDTWLSVTNANDGTLTVKNLFAPAGVDRVNDSDTQTKYFNKWYRINTEGGTVTPTGNQAELQLLGDDETPAGSRRTNPNPTNDIHSRTTGSNKVELVHSWHGDTLYNTSGVVKSNNTGTIYAGVNTIDDADIPAEAAAYRDNGHAISMIKVNRSGHVLDVASKNLDLRYTQASNMGTKPHREDNGQRDTLFSPDDFQAVTPTIADGTYVTNNNNHATVLSEVVFNDYGTIQSYESYDLGSAYYNKTEVNGALESVLDELQNIDQNFFKNDENSNSVGTAKIETGWLNQSEIRFSHNSTKQSSIYQNSTDLRVEGGDPNSAGDSKHIRLVLGQSKQLLVSGMAGSQPIAAFDDNKTDFWANNTKCLTVGTTLYSSGDIVAYHSFSDSRLKSDVSDIAGDEALTLIKQLQGVRFNWKDDLTNTGRQIGLIAQQVEPVVPEVVKHNRRIDDDELYKQVDYDKLVPLLIESVKTLSARVEQLESELNK